MYKVEFSKRAQKDLKKLDKPIRTLIIAWIEKNLNNIEDPRSLGKNLVGNKKGLWRYRIGGYRLICIIEDERLIIHALNIGHRSDIYSM